MLQQFFGDHFVLKAVTVAVLAGANNWLLAGGGWKSALYNNKPPFDIPAEDWFAGAVFALIAAGFSGLWWPVCIFLGVCCAAGRLAGLGRFMAALLGKIETVEWGIQELTKRGAQWGGLFALGVLIPYAIGQILTACGIVTPLSHMTGRQCAFFALGAILAGFMQGIIAYASFSLFNRIKPNRVFNGWTVYEIVTMAIMSLAILVF